MAPMNKGDHPQAARHDSHIYEKDTFHYKRQTFKVKENHI